MTPVNTQFKLYPSRRLVLVPESVAVRTYIPHAVQINGSGLAVPHRVNETKVLRNLGFKVPSPIMFYYDWPGFEPFDVQRKTSALMVMNTRAYILNDMGTGKTMSGLWAYDFLKKVGIAVRMVVVAPLSTLDSVWADEIFFHMPHLSCVVVHGPEKKRDKLLTLDKDIYIVNPETAFIMQSQLRKRKDINIALIDELSMYRNSSSNRWKGLNHIIEKKLYVWGMTGTPTPNAPTDAYALAKLVTPGRITVSERTFKSMTMVKLNQYRWLAKPTANQIVARLLQPSIRAKVSDCVDLPPVLRSKETCELSKDQSKAYKSMMRTYVIQHQQGMVTAANAAVKMGKLLQVSAGMAYNDQGQAYIIDSKPRFALLKSIIDRAYDLGELTTNIVILASFTATVDHLRKFLQTTYPKYETFQVTGATNRANRSIIFSRFANPMGSPCFLVADPRVIKYGLTFTTSRIMIWYTPPISTEVYLQANARLPRPGQKSKIDIIHLQSTPAERVVYDRVEKNESMQTALLDMLS